MSCKWVNFVSDVVGTKPVLCPSCFSGYMWYCGQERLAEVSWNQAKKQVALSPRRYLVAQFGDVVLCFSMYGFLGNRESLLMSHA